jgi:hypothetical protein
MGVGRAFMVARGWGVVAFTQGGKQGNRTRATLKALPAPRLPPSPLRMLMGLLVG